MAPTLESAADAAIWDRQVPQKVTDWLEMLAPEALPEGRFVLNADQVAACMRELFLAQGIADGAPLAWLAQDAQTLAHHISDWFEAPQLRLRLEPVFDDACAKMHIDKVIARLICTYRGPGTELGVDGSQRIPATAVPTGMPILLKGSLWPSPDAPKLRHRSPPISGTGLTRLVLVLEACPDEDKIPAYDHAYRSGALAR